MVRFTAWRVISAVPQLCVILGFVFVLLRVLGGNPIRGLAIYENSALSSEEIRNLTARYHLGDSIPSQLWFFVSQLVHGSFGESILFRQPVVSLIGSVLPNTLELAAGALLVGWPLGVFAGTTAARYAGTIIDVAISMAAAIIFGTPAYLLGLLLLFLLSFNLHWFPAVGDEGFASYVLPCLTLAVAISAPIARFTRAAVLEASTADHVTVARAKGLNGSVVWRRHVLRTALSPLVSMGGLVLGSLLGGAVFVETVFARPGIGRLALQALQTHDFPVIQGLVTLLAIGYVLVNLAVDLLSAFFDPRVRDTLTATHA
jgi:ABC-type dipeptide/oligopeptide/nickel transport system permease component